MVDVTKKLLKSIDADASEVDASALANVIDELQKDSEFQPAGGGSLFERVSKPQVGVFVALNGMDKVSKPEIGVFIGGEGAVKVSRARVGFFERNERGAVKAFDCSLDFGD